ncbi:MAG: hypothetical protein V1736_01180 [Pseudomonadota bacterium]
MKAKEGLIKDLDALDPGDLVKVYDFILALKGKAKLKQIKSAVQSKGYLRVREALSRCRGSLSDDILADREERI